MSIPDPIQQLSDFDWQITHDVQHTFHDAVFKQVAGYLAGPYLPFYFLPVALLWLFRGGARALRLLLVAFVLSCCVLTLAVEVLEPLVSRQAPSGHGLGFPAPNVANAFFLATFFSFYYLGMGSWTVLVALGVATASILQGDCFFSDCVAGALIGVAVGTAGYGVTRHNLGRKLTLTDIAQLSAGKARHMSRK
jgi:hypothetical protein